MSDNADKVAVLGAGSWGTALAALIARVNEANTTLASDMIFAEVPDRAHIPFLDEPESQSVLHQFIGACHDLA